MTQRRVQIEIEGKVVVDADVSKAQEQMKKLHQPSGTIGGGGPAGPEPATIGGGAPVPQGHSAPPNIPIHNAKYFEHAAERSYHAIASRATQARSESDYRKLTDGVERAMYNASLSGNKELVSRMTDLKEEIKRLEDEYRKGRQQAQQAQQTGGNGGGTGGMNGGNTGWNMWSQRAAQFLHGHAPRGVQQALTGMLGSGVAGSVAGGAGKLLTGPLGLVIGGLSAANWAFNSVNSAIVNGNAPARNEISGYADLARQYGSDRDFLGLFRDGSGWTNSRFAKLGYTATQAAHVASVYDRPGGMMNDTESILQFARTTGTEESRVAAIAQMLGRNSSAKGGNADELLRIMKLSMTLGVKDGIAQSETMNSLTGAVQRNQSRGFGTNNDALAYFAGIQYSLNAKDKNGTYLSQTMRGERGLNVMQGFMQGIGEGGGDPGIQYFLASGLMKKGLPDWKKLGMSQNGKQTAEGLYYENLKRESPLAAAQYLMKVAGSGNNPEIMGQLSELVDQLSGGSTYLKTKIYEQLNPGATPQDIANIVGPGGLPTFLGKGSAKNMGAGNADRAVLNSMKTGQSLTDDVQGGNKINNQNMFLRVAEQDRDIIESLSKLNLTAGLEEVFARFKNGFSQVLSNFSKSFGGEFTQDGSMAGSAGQDWNNPSGAAKYAGGPNTPAQATVRGGVAKGAGGVTIPGATSAGVPTAANASRTLAAIAQQESGNGTHPDMNKEYINIGGKPFYKSAAGLFQMQSKWLPGEHGWAKESGIGMVNPDGSKVTTEKQARAWQLAHPQLANMVATDRIERIEKQVKTYAKKHGQTLTDAQAAAITGVLWHRNGGGNIDQLGKYLGNSANGLTFKDGKLITDPRFIKPPKDKNGNPVGNGDSVEDATYFYSIHNAYQRPDLPPANLGFASGPTVTNINKNGVVLGKDAIMKNLGLSGKRTGTPFGKDYKWGQHIGEDIFSKTGTPVRAPFSGSVTLRQNDAGQGNVIDLFDKTGQRFSMIHLEKYADGLAEAVKKNHGKLHVTQGQLLGYVGQTGTSAHKEEGPGNAHLHFHAMVNGKFRDPYQVKWQGFRRGGYTGDQAQDEVTGIVHGQEFVMTAEATRKFRPVLESMNHGGTVGAQSININFGGNVTFHAPAISDAAQEAVRQEYGAFQRRAAGIVQNDLRNQRGIR